MTPIADSAAALLQEEFLRATWDKASLPLQDTRLEVMESYEEQWKEARSALIQHHKLYPETAPQINFHVLLRRVSSLFSGANHLRNNASVLRLKRLSSMTPIWIQMAWINAIWMNTFWVNRFWTWAVSKHR